MGVASERFINNRADTSLIDVDTGEVVTTIGVGDKVRITRKASIDSFAKFQSETVELNSGRQFVKQFPDISERICSVLNANEVWLFTFLTPYIGTNSGVLKLSNGWTIGKTEIVKLVSHSMSKTTTYRTIDGLLSKGVLARCYVQNEMYYVVNPYVCQRGSKANATLLTLFSKTEWAKG